MRPVVVAVAADLSVVAVAVEAEVVEVERFRVGELLELVRVLSTLRWDEVVELAFDLGQR